MVFVFPVCGSQNLITVVDWAAFCSNQPRPIDAFSMESWLQSVSSAIQTASNTRDGHTRWWYMLILWLTSVHTCNDRCLQFLTLSRDLVQEAPIPQLTSWTSHCPSIDPPKSLGECSWPWSGSVSLAARWALASAKIREIAWHSNSNSSLWIHIGARPSGAYHCINGNSRILKWRYCTI